MPCSTLWIAPHLRVLIADSDRSYCASLKAGLKRLGFRNVDETARPGDTLSRMRACDYDIIMLEVDDRFQLVWDVIEQVGSEETLIVGMSLDRSGHEWIDAIKQGANAILMKAFHEHLLQPVLAHLLASPAAHHCRIVQFPRPQPIESLAIRSGRRLDFKESADR
jgi:DNA-binding response OmpR family regulator